MTGISSLRACVQRIYLAEGFIHCEFLLSPKKQETSQSPARAALAFYTDQQRGLRLWSETQKIQPGRYGQGTLVATAFTGRVVDQAAYGVRNLPPAGMRAVLDPYWAESPDALSQSEDPGLAQCYLDLKLCCHAPRPLRRTCAHSRIPRTGRGRWLPCWPR